MGRARLRTNSGFLSILQRIHFPFMGFIGNVSGSLPSTPHPPEPSYGPAYGGLLAGAWLMGLPPPQWRVGCAR